MSLLLLFFLSKYLNTIAALNIARSGVATVAFRVCIKVSCVEIVSSEIKSNFKFSIFNRTADIDTSSSGFPIVSNLQRIIFHPIERHASAERNDSARGIHRLVLSTLPLDRIPLLPSMPRRRCKEKSDSLISHIVARPGYPRTPRCVIARFNHTTSARPSLAGYRSRSGYIYEATFRAADAPQDTACLV